MDSLDLVKTAFKKYKQNIYYEQLDLFQRKKLAEFESEGNLNEKLEKLANIIDSIENGNNCEAELIQLIKKIDYNLIPKNIYTLDNFNKKIANNDELGFLTNKQTSDEYILEGVNYFIDAPIEIHLISVIWVMKAGIFLDSQLCNTCFGFRLNDKIKKPDDKSSHLFKLYHEQYASWRNHAIEKAETVLKIEKKDIAILSLDLKQCFYNIEINFDEIARVLEDEIIDEDEKKLATELTKIIDKIHSAYREKISSHLECTHEQIERTQLVLPIGLVSSGILCNWYLKNLDDLILKELNPEYYGRYVDDFLIVISNPVISEEKKVHNFIEQYFCQKNIFKSKITEKYSFIYQLIENPNLQFKEDKIILHFYAADHSFATLEVFKRKISENSSAFYLLPDDDLQYYINETAYNLLFDGSTNKFRNLTGCVENITELSKNLTNIITGLGQSEIPHEKLTGISDQIFQFYKGKNFINFSRTWEKVFTYTIITKQEKEAAIFYLNIQDTIKNIKLFSRESIEISSKYNSPELDEVLIKQLADLQKYLNIAISLPVGLLGTDSKVYTAKHKEESVKKYKLEEIIDEEILEIEELSEKFRRTNLIRHNYIVYPLINYTDYKNSLIDWDKIEEHTSDFILDTDYKIEYSPRFIHFDEFYLFSFLKSLLNRDNEDINLFRHNENFIDNYLTISHIAEDQCPISLNQRTFLFKKDDNEKEILIFDYFIPKKYSVTEKNYDPIKIGVANIKVTDNDLKASYNPQKKPNLSFERQKDLFNVLNLAKKEKCDLLVLPELSVPYRWLPFMIKYSRNHQMGIIFGMEYWKVTKATRYAY